VNRDALDFNLKNPGRAGYALIYIV